MYCKQCDLRLRRGLRPDPACLECRAVSREAKTSTYPRIPLDAQPRAVREPAPASESGALARERLRGHLVCVTCRRLLLPSAARTAEGVTLCEGCFLALPTCRYCSARYRSGADGSGLCPTCRDEATACTRCGVLLMPSELYLCDSRALCETCYDGLEECDRCGSKMLVYDENAITLLCAECRTSYAVCEICGAIVSSSALFMVEEHTVCPRCFDGLDECEDCGATVFAGADDVGHPRLCAQCLDHYVLCESCRDPIPLEESDKYVVDERVLCENCYDDLPECEECYRHFYPEPSEERGTVACPDCRDNFTTCDACGARVRFTDAYERKGRLLCAACNRRALLSDN